MKSSYAWSPPGFVVSVVLVVLFALPTTAFADPSTTECSSEEAKEYVAHGLAHARADELVEARVAFQRALGCRPHPDIHFNLWQIDVLLGRPVEAKKALQQYLELGGDKLSKEERQTAHHEMGRLESRIGQLAISLSPEDATLYLDGEAIEAGRRDLEVAAGAHVLEAEQPGYSSVRKRVWVGGKETVTVSLLLESRPQQNVVVRQSARLFARCPYDGVRVLVDGELVGVTPFEEPQEWDAGLHSVVFSRPGFEDSRVSVVGMENEVVELDCAIKPLPTSPRPLPPLKTRRWVSALLGGAGAGLAVASLFSWAHAEVSYREWRDEKDALADLSPSSEAFATRQTVNNERAETIQHAVRLRNGFAIAAAGLAASSVGFALIPFRRRQASSTVKSRLHGTCSIHRCWASTSLIF